MVTIEQIKEVANLISNREPYVTGVALPTKLYEVLVKSDKLEYGYITDTAYIEFDNGNSLNVIHNPLLDNDYMLVMYNNGRIEAKKIQIN